MTEATDNDIKYELFGGRSGTNLSLNNLSKVNSGAKLLVRCYGKYGCFSIAEPFLSIYRPINLFPISVDILKVEFLLKTRRNPEKFEKIIAKNDGTAWVPVVDQRVKQSFE
ncbi:unnamed protein product [Oppiella nova]|uniref:Uncharacterized protein n=1 Tax=Oppiella nova TaxID=334625 RepID=A0A7R9MH76_9ACAR|nr:unnamed protein product [Oppiella nova]CAG2177025.1 unnamed protein product [Oppiella nova]